MALFGDVFGGNQRDEARQYQRQSAAMLKQQEELLKAMGGGYKQYAPQINAQFYQMAQENPDYFNALWGQQRQQIMRGGEQLLGGTLTGLQRSGMINSGQAGNLLAGVSRGQGEALSSAYLQNQMSEDERRRLLWALLSGQVNPLGAQALAGYGGMSGGYGNLANISAQDTGMMGLLGQGAGIYAAARWGGR